MSSHLYVYVGAFFLVPELDVPQQQQVRCCSNATCGKPAKRSLDNFCGYCGSPIVAVTKDRMVKRYPRPDDLDGDFAEVVSRTRLENGSEVWLPNARGYGLSYSEGDNNQMLLIQAADITAATARVREDYRDIMKAFQAKFGVELIDAFGAIPYYN